jgi:hypothetical protein
VLDLPTRPCPECGAALSQRRVANQRQAAASYDDCLRQCDQCGVGLSNARTPGSETAIYRDVIANVPATLRQGFLAALEGSINELNRQNKIRKAAYSTSEDALTWTYFNHLRVTGRLGKLGLVNSSEEARLILWGAEIGSRKISAVPAALAQISHDLGETRAKRTEPDVILDFGKKGLAVIEVKYRSGNESKEASYPGWQRYIQGIGSEAFIDTSALLRSGCYELARNWRFGWELGLRLHSPVVVINLGPGSLFRGSVGVMLDRFECQLRQSAQQRFLRVEWRDLLERVPPEVGLSDYFSQSTAFASFFELKPPLAADAVATLLRLRMRPAQPPHHLRIQRQSRTSRGRSRLSSASLWALKVPRRIWRCFPR